MLAQTESVFALSNGHIGLRGNLDEGEPFGLPGTYLNGFYELRPLPYAEAGYGYPESGQTVVNVTNGKIIRLLVDDEPFDVRYGELLAHERVLDLRAGVLRRARRVALARRRGRARRGRRASSRSSSARWPRSATRSSRSTARCASSCSPSSSPTSRCRRSPTTRAPPPRSRRRCASEEYPTSTPRVVLVHSTQRSKLRLAAGMDHVVEARPGRRSGRRERARRRPRHGRGGPRAGRAAADREVPRLRLVEPRARCRRCATRSSRRWPRRGTPAGTGLLDGQREYLDDFWDRADVEIDGDAELQQAVRFALFHALQAGARAERRAIAAKGLTGPGYDGHTFWDTEASSCRC